MSREDEKNFTKHNFEKNILKKEKEKPGLYYFKFLKILNSNLSTHKSR